jgi:hypothetical protein
LSSHSRKFGARFEQAQTKRVAFSASREKWLENSALYFGLDPGAVIQQPKYVAVPL